ncbi:hypothetical protein ACX80N_17515 [Arthrobacter sp. MDT2-16]
MRTRRRLQWFRDNKAALPSVIALLGVAAFWLVGLVGGVGYLAIASSPMAMLTGLYMMLAAVAVSIIIAILAINDLLNRYVQTRARR